MTVNSVTQTCMSFTSQNYGAGKSKRMDKVLIDCIILSVVITSILGVSAYGFGPELLKIYTEDAKVIQCGIGNSFIYNGNVFPVWTDGSFSGGL